ncbi:hypothetical protein [Novosphingobium resinovorum]|uniref:Uncharacterized protein n=1 Tax=Novosphingobium resinovorum TaxID=158500 RepID=A0A1D8A2U4_9SPHN|nr:hypothetical protein [Novosphingobium resinovorum]AOR76445.1 hypothetical protein BES08_06540 [Novosphingobium resinovorum]
MNMNESQRGLASDAACAAHEGDAMNPHEAVHHCDDDPAAPSFTMEASAILLRAAERCGEDLAQTAHDVRCLQAARGGNGATSQTAALHLAHHRLKAVDLQKAHGMIEKNIAQTEAALAPLVAQALEKMLDLEVYRADLERCEIALERRENNRSVYNEFRILEQARSVVGRLARLGVQEGHWSTVTRRTLEKIAAMILADNEAAGFGSPDNPRMDWKRNEAE